MTRSEESLEVGTQRRETGRVRLRKYVVTEQVTQTVPVSHEEIRVEREPLSDADTGPAGAGAQIGEEEREVTELVRFEPAPQPKRIQMSHHQERQS